MNVDSITVQDITDMFDKRISGQEDTKRKLAAAVAMHYKVLQYNQENAYKQDFVKKYLGSIMLYGPSGSGKTEFVRTLHDGLGVPVEIMDTSALTPAGFKGQTIWEAMGQYYADYGDDADYGIIVFDEFDKLVDMAQKDKQGNEYARSMINEFLKLAEGKNMDGHDTSDLLFVFMGSFNNLLKVKEEKKERKAEKSVGFGACQVAENKSEEEHKDKSLLTNQDFIRYGINLEFMGRIFLICRINALSRDEMRRILTTTTNSPLKLYKDVLDMEGNRLTFSPTAINYIVDEALKLGMGARGMEKVLTPYMLNIIYELNGKKNMDISVTGMDMKYNRIPLLQKVAEH